MANMFGRLFSINGIQRVSMAGISHNAESVTERVHDNSWSVNLETPEHAENRELVLSQAIDAVEHTARGNYVNVVTHENHGHPKSYLFDVLTDQFGGDIEYEYVEQCGCGGHVTKVHVE
jgi:putative CGCGG family rSAM target protein